MTARLTRVAGVPVLVLLALAACSPADPPAPAASELAAAPESSSPGTASATPAAPEAIAPLTGEGTGTKEAARSAVAVVVSGDRPRGLDRADIVYEEFSDVIRWLALFQSGDATAWPVTAARPMDPMLLNVLRPVYAYAGGPAGVVSQVRSSDVTSVDASAEPDLFDGPGPRLRTSTKALRRAGDKAPGAVPMLQYVNETADPAPGMRPASRITVRVPGHPRQTWTYDDERWRPSGGADLAPVNLVIQFVGYKQIQIKHPDGPVVPSARVFGTGRAVVATGGEALEGIWRKAGVDALTTYSTSRGVLARMVPGRTVVLLAPSDATVTLR